MHLKLTSYKNGLGGKAPTLFICLYAQVYPCLLISYSMIALTTNVFMLLPIKWIGTNLIEVVFPLVKVTSRAYPLVPSAWNSTLKLIVTITILRTVQLWEIITSCLDLSSSPLQDSGDLVVELESFVYTLDICPKVNLLSICNWRLNWKSFSLIVIDLHF